MIRRKGDKARRDRQLIAPGAPECCGQHGCVSGSISRAVCACVTQWRDVQVDGHTDRYTNTHSQSRSISHSHTGGRTDRHRHKHTFRVSFSLTHRRTHRQIHKHTFTASLSHSHSGARKNSSAKLSLIWSIYSGKRKTERWVWGSLCHIQHEWWRRLGWLWEGDGSPLVSVQSSSHSL